MTTEQTQHTSQAKTNLEIGEVTMIIHNHLRRRDEKNLSRINPDQIHLTLRNLTGWEIETRVTTYLTTRNSQIPTMVTSRT